MVLKARLAGVFYLVLAVCGGFSELVVRAGVVVTGDAAATAATVRASAGLFRIAFATDVVNIVCFHLGALRAANSDDGLVLRLLEAHADGYLVAQVFFGLWLLPLGYLVFRSGWFPRALGVVVMAGSAGYLGDLVVRFAAADLRAAPSPVLLGVASLAEVSLLLWLLVRSVRVPVPQFA